MRKLIEEIHREFNVAGDVLLREAQEILKEQSSDKAIRLESVGFKLAKGVKEGKEQNERKEEAEKLFTLINDYAMRYPNNRFITENQVNRICQKYNLVCGPVASFKGFVPEKNLKEVEGFESQRADVRENVAINIVWAYTNTDEIEVDFFTKKFPNGIPIHLISNYYVHESGLSTKLKSYDLLDNNTKRICAPAKDMELSGLKKVGKQWFSFTRAEVPDPVVLQPVKGGYLIVTAWGDEASDEDVVNHKDN